MSVYMVGKRHAISEGVIYMIIKLSKRYTMKIINVYAPTSTSEDIETEEFFEGISTAKTWKSHTSGILM